MGLCIICRHEKERFNEEHVIPFAVGGKVVIRLVCEDCNNKMGTQIDPYLTNMFVVEMKRHELSLPGRTGKVPDPFIGPAILKEDENEKVIIKRGSDNELFISPIISDLRIEGNGPYKLSLTAPASGKKEIEKKISRFLKRHNIDRSQLSNEKVTVTKNNEPKTASKQFTVNEKRFALSFLKIAYEFTTMLLNRYFLDEKAKEISQHLFDCQNETLPPQCFIGTTDFKKVYFAEIGTLIDFDNDHHYIVLIQAEYGLVCHVNIFSFHEVMLMSEKTDYLEVGTIWVLKNDVSDSDAIFYDTNAIAYHYSKKMKL